MSAVRSLGVRAAAPDDQCAKAPRLNHVTRFVERPKALAIRARNRIPKRQSGCIIHSTTILNANLIDRSTVRLTCVKSSVLIDALPQPGSTLSCIAALFASIATRPAVLHIRHNIGTYAIARRPRRTCKRQWYILMNFMGRLIVKFCPKHSFQFHPLELDRFGLLHGAPRQLNRIRAFLPRSHERAVTNHSILVRESPADNVIYAIGVREHGGEDDRFAGGDFRDVRLQAEKHRCPLDRCCSRIATRWRSCARVIGLPGPSASTRSRTRSHCPGHRGRGRVRGLIVSTAGRKDHRKKHEVPSCAHVMSLTGDADICNQGSQY